MYTSEYKFFSLFEERISMKSGRLTNKSGITLLEVLVSMLILGFGILGLAPMVILSIDANSTSRDFSIAAELAKEKLEFYEGLDTITTIPYTETEDSLQGVYRRQTFVTDSSTDSLIPGSLCKVDVVISWTDQVGIARSTRMSTLVRKGS
jgi:Tfp pilus assembly protein PilV